MVELIAKSACAGLLPLKIGGLLAAEKDLGVLTAIMPFIGQDKAASDMLKAVHGVTLPEAGRVIGDDDTRIIWFGRGQVLLAGPTPSTDLAQVAALSDQSDAWCCVELSGAGAVDVLARLVPIDLRASAFPKGHTARSMIGHMNGSVSCLGSDRFLMMVFRSMAGTLVHELAEAMETVVART